MSVQGLYKRIEISCAFLVFWCAYGQEEMQPKECTNIGTSGDIRLTGNVESGQMSHSRSKILVRSQRTPPYYIPPI